MTTLAGREQFGPEAQAVVERLHKLVVHVPLDRERVETALTAHLAALGLQPLPIRWIVAEEGTDASDHAGEGFMTFWKGKAPSGLHATSPRALHDAERAAEKAEKGAGGARKAADKVGAAAAEAAAPAIQIQAATLAADRATQQLGTGAKVGSWVSDKSSKGLFGAAGALVSTSKDQTLKREAQHAVAGARAARAAMWLARAHALRASGWSDPAVDRMADVYLPLVDAVEAGLWLCWVEEGEILAVASLPPEAKVAPRPAVPPRAGRAPVPKTLLGLDGQPSRPEVKLARKTLKKGGGYDQAVAMLAGDMTKRLAGAMIFGELGDARGIVPMARVAPGTPDARYNHKVAEACGQIAHTQPDAVRALLTHEEAEVRGYAALGLAYAGDPDVAFQLVDGLRGIRGSMFRQFATEALVSLGDQGVEALLTMTMDADSELRYRAALRLGEIREPRAVDPLIDLLRDTAFTARMAAAEALGRIGDPKAVEPLRPLLDDESSQVREEAGKAIAACGA